MSEQSIEIKLGDELCLQANPRQYPEAAGLANSYNCPRGREPGRAYVVILERELAKLSNTNKLTAALTLKFMAGETCSFVNLYFVKAWRVSGGHEDDRTNSAYVVELADKRHLLEKMTACEKNINVRCPAPPAASGASLYYADSLASGTTIYTWQTALDAIWPTLAGASPTLPYTPTGNPENFRFIGVSAWCAVHKLLEKIGCTTALNPFTGVFTVVRLGTEQADFTTAKTTYRDYLDTAAPYNGIPANIPHTIRVFFHRQEVNYGIEKDTIQGAGQWAMDCAYSEDVATGVTGAIAGTVLPLWDDLPALYGYDGALTNASDLTARVAARKTEWLRQHQTARFRKIYSGCLTGFLPGSEVTEISWYNYGDGGGFVTAVAAGPTVPPRSNLILPGCCQENIAPPDMARRQFPVYPRTDQIVQPWDGSASAGALLTANGDHVIAGRVMRYVNGSFAALENCWLMVMSIGSGTSATDETDIRLVAGDRLMGRLMGTFTSSTDTRPLYMVDASSTILSPNGTLPSGVLPVVPLYAVRNNGGQTLTKNTTGTVVLDTQIHRYPNDGTNFTLAASEITVVERKVVSLKWGIHFTAISADIAGSVYLEDNTTEIPRTRVPYAIGPAGLGHISGTIDHVMSADNAEIRMRMSETLNNENVSIYGDGSNGYAYIDIAVLRDP